MYEFTAMAMTSLNVLLLEADICLGEPEENKH